MSTLLIKKIAVSVLIAVFVLVAINLFVDRLYAPDEGVPHASKQATADGEVTASTAAKPAAVPDTLATRLAAANADKGRKSAKACTACHDFSQNGPNKVGPNLWGVVGAKQAGKSDFGYSPAISGLGGTWSFEELDAFLTNPKGYAPGTKMGFGGIKKGKKRANVIAFLRSLSDSPLPLPTD